MSPLADPPYLDADMISDLHHAAVDAGLGGMREALFNRIPRPYVASFTLIPAPIAQVLVDLGRLNGDRPLRDGSVPFRQWLRNARDLTKGQDQERVFERAILALESLLAGPLGKEAIDVSRALSSWSSKEIAALVAQRLGTRPAEDDSLDLVSSATQGSWLDLVIAAALSSRLGDVGLVQLAQDRGLVPTVPIKTRALEKMVRAKTSFQDVAVWRARLARSEPCVARVEILQDTGIWQAQGTAFLVGPDVMMTNHHVVQSLLGAPETTHNRLRFRFDYKRITDGKELLAGRVVMADEEWELLSRGPSAKDETPQPGDPEPGPEELDFALIQLAERVGEQPVGAAAGATSGALRGWLDATVDPSLTALSPGDDVFVLQHPEGDPLQIAAGRLLAIRAQRVRYDANTLPGSSGSPCFDAKLNLVALHHLGDPRHDHARRPEYNQGIPMHRIVACCAKEGITFTPPPGQKP